eukprot:g4133.t1
METGTLPITALLVSNALELESKVNKTSGNDNDNNSDTNKRMEMKRPSKKRGMSSPQKSKSSQPRSSSPLPANTFTKPIPTVECDQFNLRRLIQSILLKRTLDTRKPASATSDPSRDLTTKTPNTTTTATSGLPDAVSSVEKQTRSNCRLMYFNQSKESLKRTTQALSNDLEYLLRYTIQEALKYMQHSKRTVLTPTDIAQAMEQISKGSSNNAFAGLHNIPTVLVGLSATTPTTFVDIRKITSEANQIATSDRRRNLGLPTTVVDHIDLRLKSKVFGSDNISPQEEISEKLRVRMRDPSASYYIGSESNDPLYHQQQELEPKNQRQSMIISDITKSKGNLTTAMPTSRVPLRASLSSHWLCINGEIPRTVENVSPPKRRREAGELLESERKGNEDHLHHMTTAQQPSLVASSSLENPNIISLAKVTKDIRPLVVHQLPKELIRFYEQLTKALHNESFQDSETGRGFHSPYNQNGSQQTIANSSSGDSGASGAGISMPSGTTGTTNPMGISSTSASDISLYALLETIRSDPGLQELVPYLSHFILANVRSSVRKAREDSMNIFGKGNKNHKGKDTSGILG